MFQSIYPTIITNIQKSSGKGSVWAIDSAIDHTICVSKYNPLGEYAVYNFINNMIKESKYCSDAMKKHFHKELVMTKENNEDFKKSTKCWICDNDYIDTDVKVRDHCHITGKSRNSAYRACNINLKLNHKIPIKFHNLKNCDSHIVMQELCKFNLKINVIPNGLKNI